jgi:hypothetical protein
MFSQMLKLIPRTDFERIVKETGAERRSKGLSSWSQLVAMLFCQLGRAHSLREIEGGLRSCEGKLAHLGIEAPARSSLSYANAHRPWALFERVFYGLYETVAAQAIGKVRKFRFKNKLVSLDSTVIDLCLSLYDWAKFRRTKGAVKLHLVLDHDGYLPCFGIVTDGRVHDVKVAHQIGFAPGTIVVDDRGYNDYQLFGKWTEAGVLCHPHEGQRPVRRTREAPGAAQPQHPQRRNHLPDRRGCGREVPALPAPHRSRARGHRRGPGVLDQSSEPGRQHGGGGVQGALADRTVLRWPSILHSFVCH